MPRVTQVPSVTVEAHALRYHTSTWRVERKYEIRLLKSWPACTSAWAGRVIAPLTLPWYLYIYTYRFASTILIGIKVFLYIYTCTCTCADCIYNVCRNFFYSSAQ
jgi:hypothetical protein